MNQIRNKIRIQKSNKTQKSNPKSKIDRGGNKNMEELAYGIRESVLRNDARKYGKD